MNKAHQQLFTNELQQSMNFPPRKAVLIEHASIPREPRIKLVVFGDRCWLQTLSFHPHVTGAGKRLKQVDGMLSGHCYQKLLLVARELLHWQCKKGCRKQYKCCKPALRCTTLCLCDGQCTED